MKLENYPSNVPKKLIQKLHRCKGNRFFLSVLLNVNSGRLSLLLNKGIEPTDKTEAGRTARIRMFLPKHKNKSKSNPYKKLKPYFVVQWEHLPKEERHKVIQEYLKWKEQQKRR